MTSARRVGFGVSDEEIEIACGWMGVTITIPRSALEVMARAAFRNKNRKALRAGMTCRVHDGARVPAQFHDKFFVRYIYTAAVAGRAATGGGRSGAMTHGDAEEQFDTWRLSRPGRIELVGPKDPSVPRSPLKVYATRVVTAADIELAD